MSEEIKRISENYLEYYRDIRRHLTSEFAAEVRWLTASLFALNAGGLLASSQKDSLVNGNIISAILFWFGILFCFIFILYSQSKTREFVGAVSKLEEQYAISKATGYLDDQKIGAIEETKKAIHSKWARPLSISSFTCFSIGLLATVIYK